MRAIYVTLILSFVLCCTAQHKNISEISNFTLIVKDSLRIPKNKTQRFRADSNGTRSIIFYFSKEDSMRTNYIADPGKIFNERFFDSLHVISLQKVMEIIQVKRRFKKIEEVTLDLTENSWMIDAPEKERRKIFIPGRTDLIKKKHATISFHGRQFKNYSAYIDAKTGEIKSIEKNIFYTTGRGTPLIRNVRF